MGRVLRRILQFILIGVVAVTLFGFILMRLWNWLMPVLFGWHTITFWQAIGILILSKILFGGFRGGRPGPNMRWRRRMMERWSRMTPEDREKFRQSMRGRCGSFGVSDTDAKAEQKPIG